MPIPRSRQPFVHIRASGIHENGVFTARPFDPLDVVLEVDDSRLDPGPTGDVAARLDAPERHINHSCEPKAFIKAVDGVHYVFALRAIGASEEITIDYVIPLWFEYHA